MTDCLAKTMELELMPDHSVRITLRCDTGYQAAVLFEDISEASQKGQLHMDFDVTNRRVEIDRTR